MSSSSSTLLNTPRSATSGTSFATSTVSTAPSSASTSPPPGNNENLSPVVWKLALFTLLMIVGPIGTYFFTLEYYFHDPTPSAISAALVANLVLVGFVVVAFLEDKNPDLPTRVSGTGIDEFTKEKIRAGKKE
ncbi:hypothetical protein JCM16303_002096 [Sporobolomyces ruberrimus]